MLLSVHVTHVWIRVRCWRVAVFRTVMSQRRVTLASIDTNKGAVPPRTSKGSMPPPPAGSVRGSRPSLALRRSSVALGGGDVRSRMSLAPGQRRSVGMGRVSLAPGAVPPLSMPVLKDSRLRSKNARSAMEANLTQFLEETGFTMAGWSSKFVHEPTQSAFVHMFKHIYQVCVDPDYQMGADGKKFEEEVMLLMKEIRYPFVDDLTKTKLTAAGSQQNWPACLALLDWIVHLGVAVGPSRSGPMGRDDENELHALFFPYLWKCYEKFWENYDTYPEELADLARSFEHKNEALAASVKALEAEKDEMEAELRALTDKPSPLEREEHENQVLQGDLAKFVKYHHEVLVPKLDKSRRTIQRLHAAWDEYTSELRDKQQERERRQKLVDTQDVSSEEFERLVSEREWLARQLEELRVQNREAMEQCWGLEMALSKRQADVEKRLQVFHTGQQRIHLLPLSLPNGVELSELELVPAHPTTMLAPGVTMEAVRAKIETMRAAEVDSFRRLSDERVALQEAVDELLERLERTRRSTRSLEMRHESLREQIDEMGRISSAEEDESGAEYMRQEHLVNSMEHASSMALQQADTRVKALQLQLQEALESTADERAAMHEEICRALHTLLDLKVRVGKGLDAVTSAVHGVMRA